MNSKRFLSFSFFLFLSIVLFSETGYKIDSVEYNITGATRVHPLKNAIKIDKKKTFSNHEVFELYLIDLNIQFNNLRVFESAKVEAEYGIPNEENIIPVHLIVTTEDTVNIIALPKPGFDSNTGFEFKIKLKNYNFFGSMRELDSDINYEHDENGNHSFSGAVSFAIPFEYRGYSFSWDISSSLTLPLGDPVIYDFSTGLDMEIPFTFFDLHVGFVQSIAINDRDDDKVFYEDDNVYFTEKIYVNLPITLAKIGSNGEIVWKPQVSFSANWDFDTIQADDLKGPVFSIGHALSAGRIDWQKNFRNGFSAEIGNTYEFNFHKDKDPEIQFIAMVQGHTSFFDRIGLSSRLTAFYNLCGYISEDQGNKLRGILDKRINTNTATFLNIDIPVRIMRVDFKEITGISWTKYISFEMQVSPFFDMALTHDYERNSYYKLDDGWYSGGLELIVYPLKMRSIYARASVGFDLAEVISSGKLSGYSERDGKSIREIFVGIGLYY
ncbi:MAG TPA: hypothetical protein GXZ47_07510 [Treponema sp.]|nr:hypothetical protein [Treponema sp.]